MDARIIKILKYLEPEGVGVPKNIGLLLYEMYPNVNKMEQYSVFSTWRIIHALLEDMKTEGFIKTEQYPSMAGNSSSGYSWFDTLGLVANITSKGADALKKELNKSIEERLSEATIQFYTTTDKFNQETIGNYNFQKNISTRTFFLGCLTAIFILSTVILSILDKAPQRLQDIKTELQNQDNTLQNILPYLREIDSSMKNKKTDTVFVKTYLK